MRFQVPGVYVHLVVFFLMVNVGTSDRDPMGPTLQGSRPPQRLHGGGDSLAGEVWV